MENTKVDDPVAIASATVPNNSAPKEEVSTSVGGHLDKTAEAAKSFVTSVGEHIDKTAESVSTFVQGVMPSTADKDPVNKEEVSAAPEETKTEAPKA